MIRVTPSANDRALLPDDRLAGPMPWVLVIMSFLTILSVATGLALQRAASEMSDTMARAMTVQIIDANNGRREKTAEAVLAALRAESGVTRAERVSQAEMKALLAPWFGTTELDADLPIPALIDVAIANTDDDAKIRSAVARAAPAARIERNDATLAPLRGLLRTLSGLALTLIALMAAAMAAVVVLASRAALNTHRATIDVMHLMGATDGQVAALFQRRAAMDAAIGSTIGLIIGAIVIAVIAVELRAAGVALIGGGGLGLSGWLALLLVPVGVTILAIIVARITILKALGTMP
jgi:cell division transport system permease protein